MGARHGMDEAGQKDTQARPSDKDAVSEIT